MAIMQILPKSPLDSPALNRPSWNHSIARDKNLLWLDKNENLDPDLMRFAGRILKEQSAEVLATYPEFSSLYQKLADWVGVRPDNLILTPGSDGVIKAVFEAFVSPGDIVVHTAPTFAMYPVYCQIFGAKQVTLIYEKTERGPHLSFESIFSCLEKLRPRLFCLPNPDSPTGTTLSPNEIFKLIELCNRTGTIALIDEAYYPFYKITCAALINQFNNLIVARTFAKAWGLAALRIGYAIGSAEVIQWLQKIRPMYEVNTLGALVVEKMLDYPDVMQDSVERLENGKSYFLNEMITLGYKVLNGKGNFLHVNFGDNSEKIHEALQDYVLYRKNFIEPCLEGFSRFSSTTTELFSPIVNIIRNVNKSQGVTE
jgi:histidinol-phosphate aminotransferase